VAIEITKEYEKIETEGKFVVEAHIPEITFNAIGKRGIRRLDGYEKATGAAKYTRDVQLIDMLCAKILDSPYPHARIKKMDTSKAETLPGVRAIVRYDDLEVKGVLLTGSYFGRSRDPAIAGGAGIKPICPLLGDEAWYEGQPLGVVVAADDEDIAKEALRLIDIEWEELPFVLDQEEALKPGAPILRPNAENNILPSSATIKRGDVEKGFKEADKIIEFKARRNAHLWAGAEPTSVVAAWRGEVLQIWVHQQRPYHARMKLAEFLNIPQNKITMYSLYQGGSFGERCNPGAYSENGINILATMLAKKTGKPVKLLYDRRENFWGESGDIMVSYFKVGAKKDGTITAVQMKNVFAVDMCTNGVDHFIENTKIPNLLVEDLVVDVNKGPAWWCRCEQLPNTLCFTLVFDHVAAELGLDPTEVALKNDGCEGHGLEHLSEYKRKHGYPDRDSLKECIEAGKKAIDWEEKWHKPGTKRLPNGRMHGIAFTWTHEWDDVRGTGSAAVLIESDGSVSVIAQQSDVGVNPWTAYCQIVADELGIRYEDVNIKPFDLDHGFALMSPDGSCCLVSNGIVVRKAAAKAKRMLLEKAAKTFRVKPEELDMKEGIIFVKADPTKKRLLKNIVERTLPSFDSCFEFTEPPIIAWAWHTQGIWGDAMETDRPRLCRQAHFMEVEVDTETGQIEVTRVVNVNDVGKAISPESVEGQQYGGTYMGVGRALAEEIVWDPRTGVRLNADLLNYKYATLLDCGPIDPIYLETGMGHGPYGTVGVAEDAATVIPALLGPAVYSAIGKWIDEYPITPDKVLKALGKI